MHQPPTAQDDQRLGAILIREAGVSADAVNEAMRRQSDGDGNIGDILLEMKVVSEDDLVKALATQMNLPYLSTLPKAEEIDIKLLEGLPINFARQKSLLPIREDEDGGAVLLAANPLDVLAFDDVRTLLGLEPSIMLASKSKIHDLINKVYSRLREGVELDKDGSEEGEDFGDAEELVDILDLTDEAPIIRWVNSLLFQAVKEGASDIHVEPGEKEVMVRYRVDGSLRESKKADRRFLPSILSRVKIMAGLNIAEKRLPQDGRIRRRIAGKDVDMRVATAPTAGGERITIRILDRSSVQLGLADLGFAKDQLEVIHELIERPHGIVMVTGPTGSGKTTSLYACIARINKPDLNILTVEDPVEYQLEGISQTQVNPKIELTFASGLRSFLRHDPDVIMVGEIRDLETAEIAIQASLTGHLVLSTIHTNDAPGAVTRLADMGVEPFLIASSVIGLLAQRLVRRNCFQCRELISPTAEEIAGLGLDPEQFFAGTIPIPEIKGSTILPPGKVYKGKGCDACQGAGYKGRVGIYEMLTMTDEVRALTLKNADSNAIKRAAVDAGMRTLRGDGALKVLAGLTTIEEVMVTTAEDD